MTLTEFLLARIAEDVQDANDFWEQDYDNGPEPGTWWRWVLAECEAKRRIIEAAKASTDLRNRDANDGWDIAWASALCFLAVPYAGHPDYRPEWKP